MKFSSPEQKMQTAIHEAGHAVAHNRLNIDHDGAGLDPDPDSGLLGFAPGVGYDNCWSKAEAEDLVLAYCAGYGALIAAGYPEEVAVCGADSDFEHTQELLTFWALPGDLDEWKARAVELMRKPMNVAAVALVTSHLQDRCRVDGEYVDVLIEVADGAATAADLQRYLWLRGLAGLGPNTDNVQRRSTTP